MKRDAAVAVAVAAAVASGDGGSGGTFGDTDLAYVSWDPPLWFPIVLGLLAGAAAWWRRRCPDALLAAAVAAWLTTGALTPVLVAQYTAGERFRSWRGTAARTVPAVVLVGLPIWRVGGPDAAAPLTAAICVAPALLGLYVGTRRDLIAGMRERAERAEREQHQRVLAARGEERAQIARDMHDVVTHRVSLMVLHTTALEAAEGRDAVAIGRRIGAIGREALAELRSLVEVLRAGEAPLAPQRGLADLPELVAESRRIGMPVTLRTEDGPGDRPPALVQHAAYRVVQEALTNVHKHAGLAETVVRVVRTTGTLRLTVTNGPARAPAPAGSVLPGGEHGLLGVAERVRLVGGDLTARATPDGGFEVAAEVPLGEAAP
ncbi:sensor histidine kinase [Actinomadura algeriensis]|uniref:histidine kinase n=1 Tax=Actinomadura algeriensis TaxID=1679523 RepID=A0ABR9JI85_9ACTN|nr:histidine kinase [Actinomadura algeriensis]MBE1530269.1 signal transduction histidine kinase [Actinomadura algeriensis]